MIRPLRFISLALALGASACTIDTPVASVTTDAGPRFTTLPAGSTLPDDAACKALVRRTGFEPRPANATANATTPTPTQLQQLISDMPWNGENAYDSRALALEGRITGAFTGTTDELLQWVACKWGFDEDHVRAEAVASSGWRQTLASDWTNSPDPNCPPDATTRTQSGVNQCAHTYGMFQVVWQYHKAAWPMFRDSTAFHLDYVFGLRRACFEGWDTSQGARATAGVAYAPNDEWGCVGAHYSGGWYDQGAHYYIDAVKGQLDARLWAKPGF
jgi:autotransporter family porin